MDDRLTRARTIRHRNEQMRRRTATGLLTVGVLLLTAPLSSKAAELRPEALQAWDKYIHAQNSRNAERIRSGSFLWSDESIDRNRRLRSGEVVVSPATKNIPQSVPHGLIHHWMGAVFLPGASLDDVFRVVRDYGRYKDFYAPNVVDSRTLKGTGGDYKFAMMMLNKALFSKLALEGEFQASYVRVDENRWYSIASSSRVQEIDDYGRPGQHELPPNQGSGYIWRLYSLQRFEERDGGVYVELEAIALSRDIPISVRWMANPIVRRISRDSLLVSLQKTEEAVHSSTEVASRATKGNQAYARNSAASVSRAGLDQ
jgi:hypothetical protein